MLTSLYHFLTFFILGLKYFQNMYRVPQKYRLKVYGSEGHKNGANHILIMCIFFSTSGHLV